MTDWTPERLARIGRHFDALVDLPDAAREAALAALAEDAEFVRELRAMLAADRDRLDLADAVARHCADEHELAGGGSDEPPDAEHYGPWRVRGVLGRGGMGVVLDVGRDFDGQVQRAALKRLRAGRDSAAIIARFAQERAVLMRLEHPNIARFLDAGNAADGGPWLAMERVDGLPLLAECARQRSALPQRLDLFVQLCKAVRHAHQHSIVHRDIKPSNVMVTSDGHLKLLDFGIAKLVDDDAAVQALWSVATTDGPMTPQYAAPEQLRGQPVSTLTDVYGLGTVLYELVCGQRPYARAGDTSPVVFARVLGDEPCRAPSAALADAPDLRGVVARHQVEGDLDAIALKALARDPSQRYASVDALLDDLERHREGRPVRARGDAWTYVARAFVRRHRAGSIAVAVAVVALVAASIVSWRAAATARAEAARAEAANAYLLSVFDAADSGTRGGFKATAQDLVAAGARRLASAYATQPELRAEAALTLGRVQLRLGDAAGAVAQLSWEDAQDTALPGHARRLDARLAALGRAQLKRGSLDAAEATARRSLERAAGALGGEWRAQALSLLSEIARQRGQRDQAVALGERAAQAARAGASTTTTVDVLFQYTNVLRETDALDAAHVVAMEALDRCAASPAACGHRLARARIQLAPIQTRRGEFKQALVGLESALAELADWLPPAHPLHIDALSQLAAIDGGQGRHAQAIARAVEVVERQRAADGGGTALVGGYLNALGGRYSAAGRDTEALATYREATELFEKIGQPDHPYALAALANTASVLTRQGRADEALPLAVRAYETARRVSGPDAATTLSKAVQVLQVRAALGEADDTRAQARELSTVLTRSTLPRSQVANLAVAVAAVLDGLDDHVAAIDLFAFALEGLRSLPERPPLVESAALSKAAHALRSARRLPESIDHAEQAVALAERADPEGLDPRTPSARIALAQALRARDADDPRARDLLSRAITELERIEGPQGPGTAEARRLLPAPR
jgi:tetratricopeptide (TPR) repeat protein